MPHDEKGGLEWLSSSARLHGLITSRWSVDGLIFSPEALTQLGAAFGFILGTAQHQPDIAAGLCASLEHNFDGLQSFYNGQPVNKDHGTYIRMAGVTHYHLRVPRRVICVYDTSDQFSFAWAAYRFDADYAADDSVEMEQGAIHGWWSAEAIGRPKYQWRRFYDGGLNFNPPSRADDAGVFRSSLRFLDGEDTDRWSRNS